MKILYIGAGDILHRHELGFIASLKSLGQVDSIAIGSNKVPREKLKVISDNGVNEIRVLNAECVTRHAYRFAKLDAGSLMKIFRQYLEDYDVIFATPREPLAFSIVLRRSVKLKPPIVLRLWSIRAAKLRDNLRFKAYSDIAIFLPSIIANCLYIGMSDASISIDHATYAFARSIYPFYASKLFKVYPPYGYVYPANDFKERDEETFQLIDSLDNYILGFTSLQKHGSYLKFEAKPHALMLYSLARRLRDTNIVLAGSSYEDWIRVFPKMTPPKNLYFIGRGFSDQVLERLYGKAKLVVAPITNRSISNRLLEALFFSRPVITSEVVKLIHPELEHGKHIYVSQWDNLVEDTIRVAKDDALLSKLENGAKDSYAKYFSTSINSLFIAKLLKALEV